MKNKLLYRFFLLILLCMPVFSTPLVMSQSNGNDIFQQDDIGSDDEEKKSKKKKKDKDKEESVTIDSRFMLSFGVDIAVMLLLIACIYYMNYKKLELVFTYFIFNIVIFLLTFVFNHVKISMGAAFGMFAIFSMLRYRTEGISAKDMTYLFIVIATGLVNAIQLDLTVILTINLIILITTFVLDGNIIIKRQQTKIILYEKIDMIKPENYKDLLLDLRSRTGLDIHKATINKIDFLRDVAVVEIYYN